MSGHKRQVVPKLSQAELRERSYSEPQYEPGGAELENLFWDTATILVLAVAVLSGGLLIIDIMYKQAYDSSLLLEILKSTGWLNGKNM